MREELLQIIRHSLGVGDDGSRAAYRNHFVAGGRDLDLCRELVQLGFMVERPASELTGGDPLFHVTPSGREAEREEKRRKRSAQRAAMNEKGE